MPAKSDKQRKFMNMVKAKKEGKKGFGGKVAKAAKSMTKKEVNKFAKTKGKLPEKVKESVEITGIKDLIKDIMNKDYTKAKEHLQVVVDEKIKKRITNNLKNDQENGK